jgi:hypothetical protein
MLFREAVSLYCENNTKHINMLYGEKQSFWMMNLVVHMLSTLLKGDNKGTLN